MSPVKIGATSALSDEESGRRNWLKCSVVSDVTNTNLHLFPNGEVTQTILNKHAVHESVQEKIDKLLLLQKGGANVEMELDSQLTISLLPTRFQLLCMDKIKILDHHLLQPADIHDHTDPIRCAK